MSVFLRCSPFTIIASCVGETLDEEEEIASYLKPICSLLKNNYLLSNDTHGLQSQLTVAASGRKYFYLPHICCEFCSQQTITVINANSISSASYPSYCQQLWGDTENSGWTTDASDTIHYYKLIMKNWFSYSMQSYSRYWFIYRNCV